MARSTCRALLLVLPFIDELGASIIPRPTCRTCTEVQAGLGLLIQVASQIKQLPVWPRRRPEVGYDKSIMPNRCQAARPSFDRDLGFGLAREGERTQGSNTWLLQLSFVSRRLLRSYQQPVTRSHTVAVRRTPVVMQARGKTAVRRNT